VVLSTLEEQQPGVYQVTLITDPLQPFTGTQTAARLYFSPAPDFVGHATVGVSNVLALQPNGEPVGKTSGLSGQVTIVGETPWLELSRGAGALLNLTIFGPPDQSCLVEANTNWTGWRFFQEVTLPPEMMSTLVVTNDGSRIILFRVRPLYTASLNLGLTTVRAGQSGSVPVTVVATGGATNLTARLRVPHSRLVNVALSDVAPNIGTARLQPGPPGEYQLTLGTRPGQMFCGQQDVARLSFVTLANQPCNVVPVAVSAVSAIETNGLGMRRTGAQDGRVQVIGLAPQLTLATADAGQRRLTLAGEPGLNYAVESSTNLASAADWRSIGEVTLPGDAMELDLWPLLPPPNPDAPAVFYRVRKGP
jgi:hypothetical protein